MSKIDPCDTMRNNLIAAALGLQACTKTDGTEVLVPGTNKRILIGDDAYLARVALPASATGGPDLASMERLADWLDTAGKTADSTDLHALIDLARRAQPRVAEQADERELSAVDALDGMGFSYDAEIGWLAPAPATPAATCKHEFHYFGGQVSARRCLHCNNLEDATPAAATDQPSAGQVDERALPPLPVASARLYSQNGYTRASTRPGKGIALFTADQMTDYVRADRASLTPTAPQAASPATPVVATHGLVEKIKDAMKTCQVGANYDGNKLAWKLEDLLADAERAPVPAPQAASQQAEAETAEHFGLLRIADNGKSVTVVADERFWSGECSIPDGVYCITSAPQAATTAIACPACNGNDANAPCAYPSEGKTGCLRDARLATTASGSIDGQLTGAPCAVKQEATTASASIGDDEHFHSLIVDVMVAAKNFTPIKEQATKLDALIAYIDNRAPAPSRKAAPPELRTAADEWRKAINYYGVNSDSAEEAWAKVERAALARAPLPAQQDGAVDVARDAGIQDEHTARGAALDRAQIELPEGYEICIQIERMGAEVRLYGPDGEETDDELEAEEISGLVNAALDAAMSRTNTEKGPQ